MIVLGLLLILAAVGATVFAVMAPSATSETIVVTALGVKVSASPLAMFLAGAVSVALLGLAYVLISKGTRRKARSRKELRQLRKDQAASGASTTAEGGHRASRRDRHQRDNQGASAERSTDVGTEASSDSGTGVSHDSDTGKSSDSGANAEGSKAAQSDRHQESEPPSVS
jgi:membrane protein implicated in regulation of membrane protease activity